MTIGTPFRLDRLKSNTLSEFRGKSIDLGIKHSHIGITYSYLQKIDTNPILLGYDYAYII